MSFYYALIGLSSACSGEKCTQCNSSEGNACSGTAGSNAGGSAGTGGSTAANAGTGALGNAGNGGQGGKGGQGTDVPSLADWVGTGCGLAATEGDFTLTLNGTKTHYFVTLPSNYDKNVPTPIVYGFHGYGRTYNDMRLRDSGNLNEVISSWAIMVFPETALGEGWDASAQIDANMQMFDELHRQMVNSYCIAPERVFAIGHSSGAFFTSDLACRRGNWLRGVGVLAGSAEEQENCAGKVAAMVIHGVRDAVVPTAQGWAVRDYFLRTNGCSEDYDAGALKECVSYKGCDTGYPVAWCEHNESTYEDTNHGWPSFAAEAFSTFFAGLPSLDVAPNGTSLLDGVSFKLDTASASSNPVWWSNTDEGAEATFSSPDNRICVEATARGPNDWDISIGTPSRALTAGHTYALTFRAWSSMPTLMRTRIGMANDPYSEFASRRSLVEPQHQQWTVRFTQTSDEKDANLAFQFGGGLPKALPVKVCVSDVSWVDEGIKAP